MNKMEYFETRMAGEAPAQYARRIAKLLQNLEDQGREWTEEPALRGCYLSVPGEAAPFAYIEYPK